MRFSGVVGELLSAAKSHHTHYSFAGSQECQLTNLEARRRNEYQLSFTQLCIPFQLSTFCPHRVKVQPERYYVRTSVLHAVTACSSDGQSLNIAYIFQKNQEQPPSRLSSQTEGQIRDPGHLRPFAMQIKTKLLIDI